MRQILKAGWIIVGLCVGIRIGAELLASALPLLISIVFVASVLFWAIGRR